MNITVAIITRNREKMLARCLVSLTKQTVKPSRVVVIDNASIDQTRKVVSSFKKKLPIQYLYEEKIGIAYARNIAVKATKGGILAFIDDDCEADKNWIKTIDSAHRKYPMTVAIQGLSHHIPLTNSFAMISQFNLLYGLTAETLQTLEEGKKIPLLDTRNVSFKIARVHRKKLLFDAHFSRLSDLDFAHQLLRKKEEIRLVPRIQVYHWERTTLFAFLTKRFFSGKSRYFISQKWQKQLLAKTSFSKRLLLFVRFITSSYPKIQITFLLPLFVLQELTYVGGFCWGIITFLYMKR